MLIDEALHILNLERPRRPKNKINCPHHADKSPSLHLYDSDYYCYSCGANGDAYGLIAAMTGEPIEDVLAEYGDGGGERRQVVNEAQEVRSLFNSYYQWQSSLVRDLHAALSDLPKRQKSDKITSIFEPVDISKAELVSTGASPHEVESKLREATAYLKDRLKVEQQVREMRDDGSVSPSDDAVSRSEVLRSLSQARRSSRSRLRRGRAPRQYGSVRVEATPSLDEGDDG